MRKRLKTDKSCFRRIIPNEYALWYNHKVELTEMVILEEKLAQKATWSRRKSQKIPKNANKRIARNGKHSGVLPSNRVNADGNFEKEIRSKLHLVMEKIAKSNRRIDRNGKPLKIIDWFWSLPARLPAFWPNLERRISRRPSRLFLKNIFLFFYLQI